VRLFEAAAGKKRASFFGDAGMAGLAGLLLGSVQGGFSDGQLRRVNVAVEVLDA
jgi:hypothetical protein